MREWGERVFFGGFCVEGRRGTIFVAFFVLIINILSSVLVEKSDDFFAFIFIGDGFIRVVGCMGIFEKIVEFLDLAD